MSDDRPRHAFFCAPTELGANSRVPDKRMAALANERAGKRRVDWAGRAVFQTPGEIGARMGQHNRVRMKPLEFSQPNEPAVDQHFGTARGEMQSAGHSMRART